MNIIDEYFTKLKQIHEHFGITYDEKWSCATIYDCRNHYWYIPETFNLYFNINEKELFEKTSNRFAYISDIAYKTDEHTMIYCFDEDYHCLRIFSNKNKREYNGQLSLFDNPNAANQPIINENKQ